jgi:hypothetical protein
MVAASSQLLPVSPQSAAGDFVAHVFEPLFDAPLCDTDDFEMRSFRPQESNPHDRDAQESGAPDFDAIDFAPRFAQATIAYSLTRARTRTPESDGRDALAARMLDLAQTMRIGAIEERAREAAHAALAALRIAARRPRFTLAETWARIEALDAARENADAS